MKALRNKKALQQKTKGLELAGSPDKCPKACLFGIRLQLV